MGCWLFLRRTLYIVRFLSILGILASLLAQVKETSVVYSARLK